MLGKRLQYLRKQKKKTQQELADILGITRPAYTAYENGSRKPDYEHLKKLADYFDTSVDFLLGRTDNPSPLEKDETKNVLYRYLDGFSKDELEYLKESLEVYRKIKATYLKDDKDKP